MTHPAELTAFLEGLAEPHILIDTDYRILAANAAYRVQFSPQASVLGRQCFEVSHHFDVPCDQAGESCPLAQARRSRQRERVLHLHHTPQGEAHVNIELTPLPDSQGQLHLYVEKMEPLPMGRSARAHEGLIGRSPAFMKMLAQVSRVAPSGASVLLLGESGTGKELVARAVHEASPRANKALVVVDCASLPETLFESELFGHERGAFTGATQAKPGLVEAASGGTLFLDEVGDIPLAMQVKLLRLLESGTYRRVGSTELRHCDLRVVAATHRHLERRVAEGQFREDLYYRLCVFPIRIPALRERREDLPLLADALLARVAPQRALRLSAAALTRLAQHPFTGNVRELRNLLERCSLLCDGPIIEDWHVSQALDSAYPPAAVTARPETAPPEPRRSPADADPAGAAAAPEAERTQPRPLRQQAEEFLRVQLTQHTGTRAELAARLGISERALYRKLRALEPPKSR